MRLLLDTHVAIWAIVEDPRLSHDAKGLISDPLNQVVVSPVSLWEIAIKHSLGKKGPSAMPISAESALELFERSGFLSLPITAKHAAAVSTLPPIHRDPFDRLLLAQALTEPLRLLTHDPVLARYSDLVTRV